MPLAPFSLGRRSIPMRFGRRDHESFIGSYDPEHEMPDPDRGPRDRWQSDVYRHNAGDGRWAYRWSPERIEDRGMRRPRRGDIARAGWGDEGDDGSVNPYDRDRDGRGRGGRY